MTALNILRNTFAIIFFAQKKKKKQGKKCKKVKKSSTEEVKRFKIITDGFFGRLANWLIV